MSERVAEVGRCGVVGGEDGGNDSAWDGRSLFGVVGEGGGRGRRGALDTCGCGGGGVVLRGVGGCEGRQEAYGSVGGESVVEGCEGIRW